MRKPQAGINLAKLLVDAGRIDGCSNVAGSIAGGPRFTQPAGCSGPGSIKQRIDHADLQPEMIAAVHAILGFLNAV